MIAKSAVACMHGHKKECLWSIYREKYGEEKAHDLHSAKCLCFKQSSESAYNDHAVDCLEYKRFYDELKKVDVNDTFIKNCEFPCFL